MKFLIINIAIAYTLIASSFFILIIKFFYPYHRLIAILLFFLSFIPITLAIFQKRALIRDNIKLEVPFKIPNIL